MLALCLGVASLAHAGTVQVLNSQSITASGSGASGIPTIASFSIPSGKNRVLFIWPSFERDHISNADAAGNLGVNGNTAGTGLGDNYPEPRVGTPPATTSNNQLTARVVGSGGTINRQNALVIGGTPSGDTRFINISTSPSGSPAGTSFFSVSCFHIVLFENDIATLLGGAASGTVTITLPDVTTPSNAGDEALLFAAVFENVEQTPTGFVRNATATVQVTSGTPGNSALAPAVYDAGQSPDEADDGKLVMGASTDVAGFATPAGHTALGTMSVTNASGNYDTTNGNVNNEPNGMTGGAYFRNGGATPGALYTLQMAGAAGTLVYGAANASFLLESDNADVGDAPVSYGTASHTISGIRLGASVDADGGLLNNAAATGDDDGNTDDENGVTMPASWYKGTTVTVPVSIQNASGYLSAWIDWNRDGDFDDSGERIVNAQSVSAGTVNLSVAIPSDASAGATYARFRVSTNNTALDNSYSPAGTVQSGEVEDYALTILADGCPDDPLKLEPGLCGCGVPDSNYVNYYADTDSDGYGAGAAAGSCTAVAGKVTNNTDCDDTSNAVYPGATENCANDGTDNDCDGEANADFEAVDATNYYSDADSDGYGAGAAVLSCTAMAGRVTNSTDCNNTNSAVYPGAAETCANDGTDNDCDGEANADSEAVDSVNYYVDGDGDAYGAGSATKSCSAISGSVANNTDCNDGNAAINPGATEVCDASNVDENCNGLADNADSGAADAGKTNFYRDQDGDGYTTNTASRFCDMPAGYEAAAEGDCVDTNSAVYPGATENCANLAVDNDCDGVTSAAEAVDSVNYYVDGDSDTYGAGSATKSCTAISGSVTNNTDCNDGNAAINPGATEVCDAGNVDENCNGLADNADSGAAAGGKTTFYVDADGDTYTTSATGAFCDLPSGYRAALSSPVDCNDAAATVYPGASETCANDGTDNDCDGEASADSEATDSVNYFVDGDTDTYGSNAATAVKSCTAISGSVTNNNDCNDAVAGINPAATEICDANNVDENCNGLADNADSGAAAGGKTTFYVDADGDTYTTSATGAFCDLPSGYRAALSSPVDCNDAAATVYPGAPETCANDGTDNDCDGEANVDSEAVDSVNYYVDGDGDTYGAGSATMSCTAINGSVTNNADCNDSNNAINPAATEICDTNNVDENCNGVADNADSGAAAGGKTTFYVDADGDTYTTSATGSFCDLPSGYRAALSSPVDCNDASTSVYPGAAETCANDGTDNDCDGEANADGEATDSVDYFVDGDGDTYGAGSATKSCTAISGSVTNNNDCNDAVAGINPAATEICDANNVDENCNGLADNADSGAAAGGKTTFYVDADGDTYTTSATGSFCDLPSGYRAALSSPVDCNDASTSVYPGAAETCANDGTDNDCDGEANADSEASDSVNYYVDGDVDTYGAGPATKSCTAISGSVTNNTDCNDASNTVYPGAVELCATAGTDNNCDGSTSDIDANAADKLTAYRDADGDGWSVNTTTTYCTGSLPSGYLASLSSPVDCDDTAISGAVTYPGAAENCANDGVDNDCDGEANADGEAADSVSYYVDGDGDAYGAGSATKSCTAITGSVTNSTDCNDGNAAINPAATEVCDSVNVDENCNGLADDADGGAADAGKTNFYADADADGYGAGTATRQCDAPAAVLPTVRLQWNLPTAFPTNIVPTFFPTGTTYLPPGPNGDGVADQGTNTAGSQIRAVHARAGTAYKSPVGNGTAYSFSSNNWMPGDCYEISFSTAGVTSGVTLSWDQSRSPAVGDPLNVGPAAFKVSMSVNGGPFVDLMNYTVLQSGGVGAPATWSSSTYRANYTNTLDLGTAASNASSVVIRFVNRELFSSYPTGTNQIDTVTVRNTPAPAYVANNADCNDGNAAINPAATEVCDASNVDENCNGVADNADSGAADGGRTNFYRDQDGDGFTTSTASRFCDLPVGYESAPEGDCVDTNSAVHPGAAENCANIAIDNDCDGDTSADEASDSTSYYTDADSDGFGSRTAAAVKSCTAVAGSVTDHTDCDDAHLMYADTDGDGHGSGAAVACGVLSDDDNCPSTANASQANLDGDSLGDACDGDIDGDNVANANDAFPRDAAKNVANGTMSAGDLGTYLAGASNVGVDADGMDAARLRVVAANIGHVASGGIVGAFTVTTELTATEIRAILPKVYTGSSFVGAVAVVSVDGASVTAGQTTYPAMDASQLDAVADNAGAVASVTNVTLTSALDPAAIAALVALAPNGGATIVGTGMNAARLAAAVSGSTTVVITGAVVIDAGLTPVQIAEVASQLAAGATIEFDTTGMDSTGQAAVNAAIAAILTANGGVNPYCDTTDADQDGSFADACVTAQTDCNDAASTVHPGAPELCATTGTDNNCDGSTSDIDSNASDKLTAYLDADGDGWSVQSSVTHCPGARPTGYLASLSSPVDCNDGSTAIYPGAAEDCANLGVDNDCDGVNDDAEASDSQSYYLDGDVDGYGAGAATKSCSAIAGSVTNAGDCDDADAARSPLTVWYPDADQDGRGVLAGALTQCARPSALYARAEGDLCPNDPLKTDPGTCGCGTVDADLNGNGVPDCSDNTPPAVRLALLTEDANIGSGEKLYVTVAIQNGPVQGVGAQVVLAYDRTKLSLDTNYGSGGTFYDIPEGSMLDMPLFAQHDASAGKLIVALGTGVGNSNLAVGGALLKLRFTCIGDYANAANAVSFTTWNGFASRISDAASQAVTVATPADLPAVSHTGGRVVFTSVPAPVSFWADANGSGTAAVTIVAPTARDAASQALSVSWTRSDGGSDLSTFPAGVTTVTWSATDATGNTSTATTVVNVSADSLMMADVALAGNYAASAFTRGIQVAARKGSANDTDVATAVMTQTSAGGNFRAECIVGLAVAGTTDWSGGCAAVRDPLHTLRRALAVGKTTVAGTMRGRSYNSAYVVDGSDPSDYLLSGNVDGNAVLDILDYGTFVNQRGVLLAVNTHAGSTVPHADLNGSGQVTLADLTFIQANIFKQDEQCIAANAEMPIRKISVRELRRLGLGDLAAADLNGDGMLDVNDLALAMQGADHTEDAGEPDAEQPAGSAQE